MAGFKLVCITVVNTRCKGTRSSCNILGHTFCKSLYTFIFPEDY